MILLGWQYSIKIKASYDPTGELSKQYRVTKAFEILNRDFSTGSEGVYVLIRGDIENPKILRQIHKAIERMKDDEYIIKQNGRPKVEWLMSMASALMYENFAIMLTHSLIDHDHDGLLDQNIKKEQLRRFLNAVYRTSMGRYYLHRSENGKFDSLLINLQTKTKMGYHGEELLRELQDDFKVVNAKVMMTALVGAIVVGMGIDYPIHIASRWTIERRKERGSFECLRVAVKFTGKEVFSLH